MKYLEGKWFHTFSPPGQVEWQGKVVAVEPPYVALRIFEWLTGEESVTKVLDLGSFMERAHQFYESSEEMLLWYKNWADKT